MSGPRQITIQVESTSGAKVGDPATTTTTANDSANQNAHAHHHGKPKKFNDVLNDLAKDAVSYETRDPIIMKLNNGDAHYDENSWLEDLIFYFRNNHEILSMLPCVGAHPKHPFTRCERFICSFVTWNLAFVLTCLLELLIDHSDYKYWVELIVGGILLSLYGMALRQIAQCSCVQSNKIMKGVRKTAELASITILCQCFCHGLCLFIIGMILVSFVMPEMMNEQSDVGVSPSSSSNLAFDTAGFTARVLGAKITDSLVSSPIILFLLFNCKRRSEMAKLRK